MRSISQLSALALLGFLLPMAGAAQDPLPPGLSAAIAEALDPSPGYAPRPVDDGTGWLADNPAQAMSTTFTSQGVAVASHDLSWDFGLDLVAYGRGTRPAAIAPVAPRREQGRIEYRRSDLVEWYVNERRGIEQLFTLRERRPGVEALSLVLRYRGGLTPALADDDRTALFHGQDGEIVLRYAGLFVTDADGRELPARLELAPGQLRIRIDDSRARYPILVDPVVSVEQATLWALDGTGNEEFGTSVAYSADTAAVGAPLEDSMGTATGAVYVFVREDGVWTQQAKLSAPTPRPDDRFGTSVALDGDTLAVGCPQISFPLSPAGKVIVYTRTSEVWSVQSEITPVDGLSGDQFGRSVALDGETLVAGAPYRDDMGLQSGAAYVFTRSGEEWTEQDKLLADDGEPGMQFGISVDVDVDTVVAGAWLARVVDDQPESGAAYAFFRDADTWSQEGKLVHDTPDTRDHLGSAVAVYGDFAAIGMPGDDNSFVLDDEYGAVVVFEREAGVWTEVIKLIPRPTRSPMTIRTTRATTTIRAARVSFRTACSARRSPPATPRSWSAPRATATTAVEPTCSASWTRRRAGSSRTPSDPPSPPVQPASAGPSRSAAQRPSSAPSSGTAPPRTPAAPTSSSCNPRAPGPRSRPTATSPTRSHRRSRAKARSSADSTSPSRCSAAPRMVSARSCWVSGC